MIEAGIFDGDLVVVDRSLSPSYGQVVVASISGEVSLQVFRRGMLHFADLHFPVFENSKFARLEVWGVVTDTLHQPHA